MNKGKEIRTGTDCTRNYMPFAVAETKDNTGTSKRKVWKGQRLLHRGP